MKLALVGACPAVVQRAITEALSEGQSLHHRAG